MTEQPLNALFYASPFRQGLMGVASNVSMPIAPIVPTAWTKAGAATDALRTCITIDRGANL